MFTSAAVAAAWLWIKGRAAAVGFSNVALAVSVAAAVIGAWVLISSLSEKAATIRQLEITVAGYEEKDRLAAEAAAVDAAEAAIADAAFRSNARANGELHAYLASIPRIPACIDRGTIQRLRKLK